LDNDVEPVHSEELAAKARQFGIGCEYVVVEGVGHGFGLHAEQHDLRPVMREFLAKYGSAARNRSVAF
jgi:acetyl esterase/lipase